MEEPIRVLHVFGRLNMGGAESRVMDLYRHIDRTKVQFDFLVHYRMTRRDRAGGAGNDTDTLFALRPAEDFDEEARSLGARIYVLPRFTGANLSEYKKACHRLFAQHHGWAVIEGHMTSMASVYLPIAKEEASKAGENASLRENAAGAVGADRLQPSMSDACCTRNAAGTAGADRGPGTMEKGAAGAEAVRIPFTIAHARSAGVDPGLRGLATRAFRRTLPDRCDMMMSCSRPASLSVFGEKALRSGRIVTVPNALELSAFRFDPVRRRQVRETYGISESTVVFGHVGRFDPVKNQSFLAGVGAALRLLRQEGHEGQEKVLPADFLFLFVGEGDLQPQVREAFEKEGLSEHVIFAGKLSREKTAAMYQAFDAFVLPSLYEGLPGTVIEAQAAGLPCVIADTITDEVAVTGLVRQLPVTGTKDWALALARIAGTPHEQRAQCREAASEEAVTALTQAGYEIHAAAKRMQELYLQLARNASEVRAK